MTLGGYHALAGVGHAAGLVQEVAILQLLAESLQRVERLVELHGHRHLGQVFADVVAEDVPQAHICPRSTGSWQAAAARGPYSRPWSTRPWAKAVILVSSGTLVLQRSQAHCTGLPPKLLRHAGIASLGNAGSACCEPLDGQQS